MKTIVMKKKQYIICIAVLIFILGLVTFPKPCINAAKNGVDLSLYTIIPSLFPFFICTNLLINTGFANYLGKYLSPIMLPIFRMNGSCALPIVLGVLSGYPVGAKTTCSLYEKKLISKNEAERLLAFSNNSGPLFILGTIAAIFYHSTYVGVVLFVSHILSALTVGFLLRFYKANKKSTNENYHIIKAENPKDFGVLFTNAVNDSVITTLMICGYVIFFAVLIELFQQFQITGLINLLTGNQFTEFVPAVSGGILELTNGIKMLSQTGASIYLKLLLTSFLLGFGGISVYFQVKGIVSRAKLSTKTYLLGKLFQGGISYLITLVLLKRFPVSLNTAVYFNNTFVPISEINAVKLMVLAFGYTLISILILSIVCFILRLFHKDE